jgi:peptidoglycan/LPS O-acetylase OafA/YrhL
MGVDIFFALSGLLITSQLIDDGSLKSFYTRRAFRILPPAIIYLVAMLALQLTSPRDVLHCLLFVRNLGLPAASPYTTHFWTLSLEEQYYLAWPVIMLLSGKRARTVAFVGIVIVCFWRAYALSHGIGGYGRTDMRCDGLLWGSLMAFALRSEKLKLLQFLPLVCLPAATFIFGMRPVMPLLPVLLAVTVLGTVQYPEWALPRLLEWKPLVWIGQRSYGIYLWHNFFIIVPVNVPMVLKLGAAIIWSALLYRYVESPLRTFGKRFAPRRVPNTPADSGSSDPNSNSTVLSAA